MTKIYYIISCLVVLALPGISYAEKPALGGENSICCSEDRVRNVSGCCKAAGGIWVSDSGNSDAEDNNGKCCTSGSSSLFNGGGKDADCCNAAGGVWLENRGVCCKSIKFFRVDGPDDPKDWMCKKSNS